MLLKKGEMVYEKIYENVQCNIKFCKRRHNYTWDDIRNILKNSRSPVKMSYVKKLSYGQQKTIDLEKVYHISNLFGENIINFISENLSEHYKINLPKDWLDE